MDLWEFHLFSVHLSTDALLPLWLWLCMWMCMTSECPLKTVGSMESQTLPCSLLIGQLLTWFCHRPDLTVDLAVNRRAMKTAKWSCLSANCLFIRHCVAGIIWPSLSKLTEQHWATQVCERKSPRAEVWVWVSQTSDISNMTDRQNRQNEKGYYTLQRNFTKTGSSMKEEIWNCQIVPNIIKSGSSF